MFPHMYKVRPRGSVERSSGDEGKAEWQGESCWRRNSLSNKWPPPSELQDGVRQSNMAEQHGQSCPSSGTMAACPPALPAPPPDAQDDLNKGCGGSPVRWSARQRSVSGSPTSEPGVPPRPCTPRARPVREEDATLLVPDGGRGVRSRSSDSRIRSSPSSATASPRVRRRWPPAESGNSSSLSDLRQMEASEASDSEVRKSSPLPPRPRSRGPPPSEGHTAIIPGEIVPRSRGPPPSEGHTAIIPGEIATQKLTTRAVPSSAEGLSQSSAPYDSLEDRKTLPESLAHTDALDLIGNEISETVKPGYLAVSRLSVPRDPVAIQDGRKSDEQISQPVPSVLPAELAPYRRDGSSQRQDIASDATLSQVSEYSRGYGDGAPESKVPSSTMEVPAAPEVSSEWQSLLGDALSSHILDDITDDVDLDLSKNAFFQTETPTALFQGGAVSYIPSSKMEFLEKQREEDKKYILNALDEEEAKLKGTITSSHSENKENKKLEVCDEENDRPYSPGPPIFKKDLERHRQRVKENHEEDEPKPPVRKSILKKTPTGTIIPDDEVATDDAAEGLKKRPKEVTYDQSTPRKSSRNKQKVNGCDAENLAETSDARNHPKSKVSDTNEDKTEAKEKETSHKQEPKIMVEKSPTPSHAPLPPPPPPKVGPPPPPPPPPGSKSDGSVPKAPPPPPGSVPPAPPKPFGSKVDPGAALPKIRQGHLDNIKKAVRTTRPDWHALMKNLEAGVKLKHVAEISDRSKPILPGSRGKNGKFVYESEKPTIVNELLHEIQRGVKLRRVRTDDRSKPDFNRLGLKKFRRQVTVEEKKKVKPEDPDALPSSSDDEEDIDRMRDDLEATKTQLADEIKKTQKLEREKKVLKIDIEALHSEIRKLKRQLKEVGIEDKPMVNGEEGIMPKLNKSMSKLRMSEKDILDTDELDTLESEIKELNGQIESQRMRADAFENKMFELEEKLKVANAASDEWECRSIFFEKKFKALQKDQSIELPDIGIVGTQTDPVDVIMPETKDQLHHSVNALDGFGAAARKSGSRRSFASQINRMESFQEASDEETSSSSEEESEEGEDSNEEADDDQTIAEDMDGLTEEEREAKRVQNETRRLERDREFWANKLEHMKAKEANVIKERNNLRERIKKFYRDMHQERVDYLKSKNELDELVRQLKDPEELAAEEDEDEEDEEEEENHDDEPGWWFDKPNLKPKKLKKKKVKRLNADGEEEEEEESEEEDLEDLTQLEEPCWSDTEGEESDPDDENDSLQVRINFLQSRTKKHEDKMAAIKKNCYLLKAEVDSCKEKYNTERIRRRRLEEELNMLVSDMP
ncbi:xin actin-binding repeat-containing protein 2 isoform X2 [Hyalella azteca]|uniref:Xin actin-binding repeat-containing protein 2 isoform X2 n=1 Tax=Hyalella azteca TaxID=294128 RepID=A0A8B7NJA7_HYAAZ|nr:xin actin-binding repeat-containing protein 2 isoform X2 [Hyalella azteca]